MYIYHRTQCQGLHCPKKKSEGKAIRGAKWRCHESINNRVFLQSALARFRIFIKLTYPSVVI